LRRAERALCGEPVPLRGLALQGGEVVQERRGLTLLARAQLAHAPAAVAYALGDRDGRGLVLEPALAAAEPASEVAGAARGGLERGIDDPERHGLEGLDLLLPAHHQRERRGLHPAERDHAPERARLDRRCTGRVDAYEPV